MTQRPSIVFGIALIAALAAFFGVGQIVHSSAGTPAQRSAAVSRVDVNAAPVAAAFSRILRVSANERSDQVGNPRRIGDVHCVEPRHGSFMCSYVIGNPDGSSECHLLQARWTAHSESSFAITLAGRTRRCATLRDAIRSLQ
jgi:hypothetical protein